MSSSAERNARNAANAELSKPLFNNGEYANPFSTYEDRGLSHVMRWQWERAKKTDPTVEELDEKIPVLPVNFEALNNPPKENIQLTWIGHASMLVQMDGLNVLTDPVFSERVSPITFLGPKRLRPTPCKLQELPKIDAVVISHNHYDHLDLATVKELGNDPHWFVPVGTKSWFLETGITNVTELTWWEEAEHKGVRFICTPAQHWCNRKLFGNKNKCLWASWTLIGASKRYYFAGDTGYACCFKEIGQTYGPFDLATIPIGAYEPRWFMRPQHVDPKQAVQVHVDINSKQSVAMHWGTFDLADEPFFEPPELLKKCLEEAGLRAEEFIDIKIGETKIY